MTITPKFGVGKLLFGMKQGNVVDICGKPDKEFRDDEDNVIYIYNALKWRLTFYQDEDFRLGYAMCSHPSAELFGKKVVGVVIEDVKSNLEAHGFAKWEREDYDLTEQYFDETHWLILQAEFGVVSKVEIGAIINDKDEFDWKFPVK
ncbi:MAG: hypothetical protein CFE23_10440 [Flavobacterium sp. BFFFF1]|uniref:hypothetical protein n=1 Tax=Flavobacterium sp. BFFFF1 TaxID=2015557 RepID=UPI000BC68815|nr:hypothetical protein [Flavobacterium sp. BFFFF1]OYU80133.1 MAG: hypothetical protein CFE23_10440 [Flavobacterium sp. BFFFF1]